MEDYDKISVIGRGAFGLVLLCRRLSDKKPVVVKQIDGALHEEDTKAIEKEVTILSSLKHRHIVRYYDSFIVHDGGVGEDEEGAGGAVGGGRLCIVMEWARGGSLEAFLERRRCGGDGGAESKACRSTGAFTQCDVGVMLTQLADALHYLHAKHIVHGDLCARNVLVCGPSDSQLLLKLCDFGVSQMLKESMSSGSCDLLKGSLECFSPEQCMGLTCTTSCDIWALGCLLYRIMTFKRPFPADNLASLTRQVTSDFEHIFSEIALTLYDHHVLHLLRSMLAHHHQMRPSALDLLKSPLLLPYFYTNYCDFHVFPSPTESTESTD